MSTESSTSTVPQPRFREPQFVFGVILLIAWIIFLAIPLSQLPGYTSTSTMPDPLASAERISAIFTAALGFVWGHFFGKAGGEKAAEASSMRARQAEIAAIQLQANQDTLISRIQRMEELLATQGKG